MRIRLLLLAALFLLPTRHLLAVTRATAQNFLPSLDGGPYVTHSGSQSLQAMQFFFGSTFNYGRDTLVIGEGALANSVIQNLLMIDLFGAFGLTDWFDVGLGMPFALMNDGETTSNNMGFGDVRLEPKFQLVDMTDYPVGLAIVPFITMPTGDGNHLVGNDSFAGGGKIAFDLKFLEKVYLGLNVGYLARGRFRLAGTTTERDDSYLLGVAMTIKAHELIDIFGEASGAILAIAPFDRESETPAEGAVGIRYHVADYEGLDVLLGVGGAFTTGYGSPTVRGFLGATYTMPVEKKEKVMPVPVEVEPVAAPPPEPPPQIEITRKVHFEKGKTVLRPVSFPLLDDVVTTLKEHSEILKVEIQGHADGGGPEAANIKSSEKRANAVRQYLIDHGIEPDRLVTKGYGSSQPIDSNEAELGRARNRRVQFQILERATPVPPQEPEPTP